MCDHLINRIGVVHQFTVLCAHIVTQIRKSFGSKGQLHRPPYTSTSTEEAIHTKILHAGFKQTKSEKTIIDLTGVYTFVVFFQYMCAHILQIDLCNFYISVQTKAGSQSDWFKSKAAFNSLYLRKGYTLHRNNGLYYFQVKCAHAVCKWKEQESNGHSISGNTSDELVAVLQMNLRE